MQQQVYQAVTGYLSCTCPPFIVRLSIIDNTNLSKDIECNSAAAINNMASQLIRTGLAELVVLAGLYSCSNPLYQVDGLLCLISGRGEGGSGGGGWVTRVITRSSRFRQPRGNRAWSGRSLCVAHLPRCFIAIFIFHWPLPCCTCLLARTCFICLRLGVRVRLSCVR